MKSSFSHLPFGPFKAGLRKIMRRALVIAATSIIAAIASGIPEVVTVAITSPKTAESATFLASAYCEENIKYMLPITKTVLVIEPMKPTIGKAIKSLNSRSLILILF